MGHAASADAKAIHALVNSDVLRTLGKPVQLDITHQRLAEKWAFLYGSIASASGGPVDYSGTSLAEAAALGRASSTYAALLQQGPAGWKLVKSVVGPTDPAWMLWAEEYGVPTSLLELP